MQAFTTLTSRVIPLTKNDVDTDQIIPARYLKVTDKNGLAEGLFYGWRYQADGKPDPTFPLNRPEYQDAHVLLAGDNFGCGSSREHAPWALLGWGIQAVIGTSFADIFRNNSLKNGLLPVIVDTTTHTELCEIVAADPTFMVHIDLEQQALSWGSGHSVNFPIDAFSKTCLLEGVDQLGYLLKYESQITAFEQNYQRYA
ncbi:MAG: 3-isopropylmalate dehydratase small subunit [Anaerolineales bacterium]|jgi:3-isopropylmalate/(R)-2-methylmalate dehydratase small subunit